MLALPLLSLLIWLYLLAFRGQFWRSDIRLEQEPLRLQAPYPAVCAVIPARNEADCIATTVRSLLSQDYPGPLQILVVDDHSTDGTATVAQKTAHELGQSDRLTVILAESLPPGWSGKLWALDQGIQKATQLAPDYLLLTDADIQHDSQNLSRLVGHAIAQQLDMASVMVRLRCDSFWERLLIPAFVFFFEKLYPFAWVNQPENSMAAAAGGCILIRRETLDRIGGLQVIRETLIDDCSLAQVVKQSGHRIWLGLSDRTLSLRAYNSLDVIWDMVARTAYTQLNYSPWLLLGTFIGMTLVYWVPIISLKVGLFLGDWTMAIVGLLGWLLMSLSYWPTIHFYHRSFLYSFLLPAIAFLYTLMTIDSALRHWRGQGGAWKGRIYSGSSSNPITH